MPHPSIADVLRLHSPRLLALPGVIGTAEGTYEGRPCVLVLMGPETSATRATIPTELEGIPLRFVETGTPEWGAMLSRGRTYMSSAPHLVLFPGLAIALVVLGFNLIGDSLRDALDPRMSEVMGDRS